MLVDQISFFTLTAIFFSLTIFAKLKLSIKKSRVNANQTDIDASKQETSKTADRFQLFKFTINSYTAFNSVVVCVGYISETYLYGGRVIFNMLSSGFYFNLIK